MCVVLQRNGAFHCAIVRADCGQRVVVRLPVGRSLIVVVSAVDEARLGSLAAGGSGDYSTVQVSPLLKRVSRSPGPLSSTAAATCWSRAMS